MIQDYLKKDGTLNNLFISKQKYLSRIVIDFLGSNDVINFIENFNFNISNLSLYYYFNINDIRKDNNFDYNSFTEKYKDIYFCNILFSLKKDCFYIWKPDGNEFFVLFGEPEFINKVDPEMVSKKHFMEVLDDDTGLSEQGRKYMLDAFAKYSGFNEKKEPKS